MGPNDEIQRSKDVLLSETNSNINFESLFLSENLLKGLKDNKYLKPSPIQLKAIPIGKCGFDLIIKSKSGTGKTAVFGIISLEMLNTNIMETQVLILSPTREIAVQICEVIQNIGKYIPNLKVESFIGGMPVKEDSEKIKGCHIVVGSPGRILHLLKTKTLNLKYTKLFVLDEADKLMEKSFQSDINQIYNSLPLRKQMLAVSATYPEELDQFLANYMQTATHVSPTSETPLLLGLKHFVSVVNFHANVIQQTSIKNKELIRLLSNVTFTQCLVFCNYQSRAENVSGFLNQNGWPSNFISAAQSQKQRLEVLKQFKEFQCRILLSTDLTARGIDAVNVDLVINYDVPNDGSTYLHRMGRAGRYGAKGICITMASKVKELEKFRSILGNIGGLQMSIAKLDQNTFPQNIWDVDCNSLEQITGTLSDKDSVDKIKDAVLNLQSDFNNVNTVDFKQNEDVENNTKRNVDLLKSSKNELHFNEFNNSNDLDSFDTNDILKQLAAGKKVDLAYITEGGNYQSLCENSSKERDLILEKDCKNSNDDLDNVTNDIMKKIAEGKKVQKIESQSDLRKIASDNDNEEYTSKILQKLAKGEKVNLELKQQSDVLSKNVNLYNIAKLLVTDVNDEPEIAETIEKMLEKLKSTDSAHSIELKTTDNDNIIKNETNHKINIEDIFTCAYQYAIGESSKHWLEAIGETFHEMEESKETTSNCVNLLQDFLDYAKDDEEPEYDGYSKYSDDYDNSYEEFKKGKYEDKVPNLQWVPVEVDNSESITEDLASDMEVKQFLYEGSNYNNCQSMYQSKETNGSLFENSLQNLEDTFNTLETMEQFEQYWKSWQQEMSNVRDYIQQNVYLDEMNNYKYGKN